MRFVAIFLLVFGCAAWGRAEPALPSGQVNSSTASQAPPRTASADAGYLEPAQLKALLRKIWLAEYRINDLLSQVQPERWKLPDEARNSVNRTLETLRAELRTLEDWRGQFEKRPDNVYLGFESHVAIDAALPHLDFVARSVSQHENPSLGSQYSQASAQLLDLHRTLGAYLGFLLSNQDQIVSALEGNLASCQNTLGYALRGSAGPAKPMRNAPAIRPERRQGASPASRQATRPKTERKRETKKK